MQFSACQEAHGHTSYIWHEILMTHRHNPDAVGPSLKDIFHSTLPIGGIPILFIGSFLNILPFARDGNGCQSFSTWFKIWRFSGDVKSYTPMKYASTRFAQWPECEFCSSVIFLISFTSWKGEAAEIWKCPVHLPSSVSFYLTWRIWYSAFPRSA